MFINFWYPMCTSDGLGDRPLRVRALGCDFALHRAADGTAVCLANICPHRNADLAAGRVRFGELECPYHGWRFDRAGRCTAIPSLGVGARIPGRARIDAYPVMERYGLVFAFLGDLAGEARPPLMEIPEWTGTEVRDGWAATLQQVDLDVSYQRSVENGIDLSHNEFVHDTHGFSGENLQEYSVPAPELELTEWGLGFANDMYTPPSREQSIVSSVAARQHKAHVRVATGHHGPASVWTRIAISATHRIHQYLYERPVDRENTVLYLVNLRNFLLEPEGGQRMIDRNRYVVEQDLGVLQGIRPALRDRRNPRELLVPADGAIGKYRERLRDWEARGWRLDVDAMEADRGAAWAIPSPARRQLRGWVIPAAPLVRD